MPIQTPTNMGSTEIKTRPLYECRPEKNLNLIPEACYIKWFVGGKVGFIVFAIC
jgi:hypothetical protein